MNNADWALALSLKPTMDEAWGDIRALSLEELEAKRGDAMDFLANAARGGICAGPGRELVVADYASIEARVLFWLAGEQRALRVMHAGQNIYKDLAGEIMREMGEPVADPQAMPKGGLKYQLGKQGVLGLGYEMGGPKFVFTCAGYGIEIDEPFGKRVVTLYRETYPKVPRLWRAYEAAAIEAVNRGPLARDPIVVGAVKFAMRGKFLHVKLPSGRMLSYYDPRIIKRPMPWNPEDLRDSFIFWGVDDKKRWRLQDMYGGKWTENIDQAISRDLMAEAMIRAKREGYTLVLTVHDELVTEEPIGSRRAEELEELMAVLPPWADGLPIAAEGWVGPRYRK